MTRPFRNESWNHPPKKESWPAKVLVEQNKWVQKKVIYRYNYNLWPVVETNTNNFEYFFIILMWMFVYILTNCSPSPILLLSNIDVLIIG